MEPLQTKSPLILFEDQHLVVLSKPAGLLSQGEHTGDENLVDWLRAYFGRNYVGLVHRLDRNTSGVMVVAKRSKAAQRLTDALQADQIERSYLAWIEGALTSSARWKHWLKKDPIKNKVTAYTAATSGAQEAALTVAPLKSLRIGGVRDITLVELKLETGRSHQIRAQAAAAKHPLLGDFKYSAQAGREISRPALHSFRISFPHPMSEEILKFEAPIPADFLQIDPTIKVGDKSIP